MICFSAIANAEIKVRPLNDCHPYACFFFLLCISKDVFLSFSNLSRNASLPFLILKIIASSSAIRITYSTRIRKACAWLWKYLRYFLCHLFSFVLASQLWSRYGNTLDFSMIGINNIPDSLSSLDTLLLSWHPFSSYQKARKSFFQAFLMLSWEALCSSCHTSYEW